MLAKIDQFFWVRAPATRLAIARILIGSFALLFLLAQARRLVDYSSLADGQFQPVGVVSILNSPLPTWILVSLLACALVSGVAFIAGIYYKAFAPLFALTLLWLSSYRHAWGQIFHSDNLMVLHILVLALAPAAHAYAWDARLQHSTSEPPLRRPAHGRYGWPLRLMSIITALTYVISGVAKLKHAGLVWVSSDVLRNQIALDNLRKIELGHIHSPLGVALLPYRSIFIVLAAWTLIVELGAPMIFINPRLARYWALAAWSFHIGIFLLMAIVFPYMALGFAYLSFFELENIPNTKPARWARTILRRSNSSAFNPPITGKK